ncbi:DUF2058 domain-containing protein [Isoalcanivorax beigongshangi]|uniref:DUF2058 domain-containing protein n=1 Tax=Isoalcanivorax beigongshangi TaxID=3238810 RepID=A0ABV4AF53_9GAMM
MSLKDQLMKAGLVDAKRARQVAHQKRQESRQGAPAAAAEQARQRQQEQAARSRELNAQREQEGRERALLAEVRQLIEAHRVPRDGGDAPYQFVHESRIRKLYLPAALVTPLARGQMAVVGLADSPDVVPADVAARIEERLPHWILSWHRDKAVSDEDDPYKDFPIPDDLMW